MEVIRYRIDFLNPIYSGIDMRKFTIIFLFILFSSGCLPKSFDYKYISLEEVKDINVLSHGVSQLSSLKSSNKMPVSYELKKEAYVLVFEIDRGNYWPSILVGAKSFGGDGLVVEAVSVSSCGRFEKWGIDYNIDAIPALRYVWSPAFSNSCEVSNNESYPDQQLIGFKVKNDSGEVLGKELLPFSLINNGIYNEIDGI